jgi:hypothetical protein
LHSTQRKSVGAGRYPQRIRGNINEFKHYRSINHRQRVLGMDIFQAMQHQLRRAGAQIIPPGGNGFEAID